MHRHGKVAIGSRNIIYDLVVLDTHTDETVTSIRLEQAEQGVFLPGDDVLYINKGDNIQIQNLSCLICRVSVFRRNLNGLLKKLTNRTNHLNRVLVISDKPKFWCMPHDKELCHPLFRKIDKF